MILIFSTIHDDHVRPVLEELNGLDADAALLDLSDFTQQLALALEYSRDGNPEYQILGGEPSDLSISECTAAWWRRPQPFELHPDVSSEVDYEFAYRECRHALEGLWAALDVFWMNDPTLDEQAGYKVNQLKIAQEIGFEIPATLVTNSPERARGFVDEHGPGSTVYKAFAGSMDAWRETRVIKSGELSFIEAVKFAPVIFQEYIPVDIDLRITVVGDEIFPAAIHSRETEYPIDYRPNLDDAPVVPTDLPDEVIEKIRSFMDQLGLVYGAIDMRLTPDSEYVFLEINPAGQWLFIEERTGQQITETVAEVLASHE